MDCGYSRVPDLSQEELLARRVSENLCDYDITGAVRLAASDDKGLCPSPDIAEILRGKHPGAPDDLRPPPHVESAMPTIDMSLASNY